MSQRPVTSRDLKHEWSGFGGSVSTFLQLAAAMYRVTLKLICSELVYDLSISLQIILCSRKPDANLQNWK